MTVWSPSAGSRDDSGSLTGTVSAFGAVEPRIMPSSRPIPDSVTATLGLDRRLQASLRISELMNRSTGPFGPGPSRGLNVPSRPADLTAPGGSADWVGTCVTWAVPPLADLRGHCQRSR